MSIKQKRKNWIWHSWTTSIFPVEVRCWRFIIKLTLAYIIKLMLSRREKKETLKSSVIKQWPHLHAFCTATHWLKINSPDNIHKVFLECLEASDDNVSALKSSWPQAGSLSYESFFFKVLLWFLYKHVYTSYVYYITNNKKHSVTPIWNHDPEFWYFLSLELWVWFLQALNSKGLSLSSCFLLCIDRVDFRQLLFTDYLVESLSLPCVCVCV